MATAAPETWVITGGGGGIGKATAVLAIRQKGANVLLADVDSDTLEATRAELAELAKSTGSTGRVIVQVCDVSDAAAMVGLKDRAEAEFGHVEVLFLNAGITGTGVGVLKGRAADWSWVMGVNLMGVINGVIAFLPLLQSQSRPSRVVATASTMGLGPAGPPGATSSYGVSKVGVIGFMEALTNELAVQKTPSPIKTSVLCPGSVSSTLWNISRQERLRPDKDNIRTVSNAREAGLKELFLNAPGNLDPEQVARQLMRGIARDDYMIETHPGQAAAMFGLRSDYILGAGSQRPDPKRFHSVMMDWVGTAGPGLSKL